MLAQLKNKNLYLMLSADLSLFALSLALAYLLRFDFQPNLHYWSQVPYLLALALPVKLVTFYFFRLYQGMWRYTDLFDFWKLFQAVLISSLILVALILFRHRFVGFPRSVFFIDAVLTFCFCGGLRVLIRTSYRSRENLHINFFLPWRHLKKKGSAQTRVLIIGAGDAGEKILREVIENPELNYSIVGFLDDDPNKQGRTVHGIPVLGSIEQIRTTVKRLGVEAIFIAVPSASGRQMKTIVDSCEQAKVAFKTLPGLGEIMDGSVSINTLRDVNYEDLLGREPVRLNTESIREYIRDKTVLVTGAGGSIGSELCRQIVSFGPERLILLDASELNLFTIKAELDQLDVRAACPAVLGQIQDRVLMERVFLEHRPSVVFHAAAYKHVPMLENNPCQAVTNNIRGSLTLMQTALDFVVERFVVVSTDKAVSPTNVMGASKRITELLMYCLNSGPTQFMAVRFGNVVGSSGSVIPVFKQQIAGGGPVRVTHPDITRYFMTISEACQLILQAGALGRGGEIFILDMGTSIRIADMARDLIRLMGKEPDEDVEIIYTGLRPGEKLSEELHSDDEELLPTRHEKIMAVKPQHSPSLDNAAERDRLLRQLQELFACCNGHQHTEIKARLRAILPEYQPEESEELQGQSDPIALSFFF